MRVCKVTKKIKYRDEIAALLSLATLRREDDPNHTEQRMYRCKWCKGWHLTSQPSEVQLARRVAEMDRGIED